jgi:hypothetical protein
MCDVLLPPGVNPTAVKYIYHIKNGYRVFTGDSKRPGRDGDPSPPSSAEVYKQSSAMPLPSLRAFVACKKGEPY